MNVRGRIIIAACVGLLSLPTTTSWADGIGDFGESVEREERPRRRPSAAQTTATPTDPSTLYNDNDPWLMFLLIWGMTPNDRFTFGGSPYGSRGWVQGRNVAGSGAPQVGSTGQGLTGHSSTGQFSTGQPTLGSVGFNAPPSVKEPNPPPESEDDNTGPSIAAYRRPIDLGTRRPRRVHLELEGSPAWVLDADEPARGYSVWGRVESTATPAFSYARNHFNDLQTDETLSINTFMVEPRWFMSQFLIIRAGLGLAYLTNQDGPLNSTMAASVSFSAFPIDPLLLDIRLGVLPFFDAPVTADLYAAIGIETVDSLFVVASARVLANEQSTLTMMTVGLRLDLGF